MLDFALLLSHLPSAGDTSAGIPLADAPAGGAENTQLTHGEYYSMHNSGDWHKCDDPWGCYNQTDGNPATEASNPQGHTQWTPVSWQSWENYNVTSGPYAVAGHGPAATTTHLTTAPCDGGDGGIAPCDGGDGGIVQKTTTTTHLSTSPCDGGDGGIVQHTSKLDGGGEYWDASIMERPDNTAGGDLWNPPDDESCCGISYHAVAAKTGLLQTAQHTSKLDGGGEYWDANILERPDNTASGTLWNPPDDESCCGISYHAVAAKTGMLSSCDGGDGGVISGCDGGDGGVVSGCACPACAGAPVQAALATIHEVPTQTRNDKEVRASPAHLILALHSCTAAAVEATGATIGRMIKGEAGESWENEFKERSKANSAAISPVSGFILDRHVMN